MFKPCCPNYMGDYVEFSGFDVDKDIQEVVPDLEVNLSQCIETGLIPASASADQYNECREFGEIRPYAEDVIQVALYAKSLGKSLASAPTASAMTEQTIVA